MDQPKVLIIDDDKNVIRGLVNVLEDDYDIGSATSGKEGIAKIHKENYSAIILDMQMPGMDGYQTGNEIRKFDPDIPIIVHTGHVKRYSEDEVKDKLSPFGYIIKGSASAEIDSSILLETTVAAAANARNMMNELKLRYEKKEEVARIAENVAHRFNTALPALEDAVKSIMESSSGLTKVFETLENSQQYQIIAALHAKAYNAQFGEESLDLAGSKIALRRAMLAKELVQYTQDSTIPRMFAEAGLDAIDAKKAYEIIQAHPDLEDTIVNLLHSPHSMRVANKQTKVIGDYVGALLPSLRHEKKSVDSLLLHDYIDKAIVPQFASEVEKKNIAINQQYMGNETLVYINTTLLHEPFTNIIQNAIEAIGNSGNVDISTQYDNNGVRITIQNDGPAIENSKKIFERRYTTKDTGSGIGLDVAYQNIMELGGSIEVQENPAAFIITLPYKNTETL